MPRLSPFLFIIFAILWNSPIKVHDVNCSFDILNLQYDTKKITVLDHLDHRKYHITFLMDALKNLFIIKQAQSSLSVNQLFAIREALSAYIAESSNLQANRVRIIPANYFIPGKPDVTRSATLHTVVPGDSAKGSKFFIKQQNKNKDTLGLTYRIIHTMSLHPDLSVIVAFDTFTGNTDRSRGNFFYDKASDTFWMIDMETSFTYNLCEPNCKMMHMFLNQQSFNLTRAEINGLIIYRDTLEKLITKYPPHSLHKKLDEFVFQAGIKPGSPFLNKKVAKMIQKHKNTISESYKSAQKLVLLLDKLITFHRTKIGDQHLTHHTYEKCNFSDAEKSHDYPMRPNVMNLDCSKEKAEYIIDRIQAYQGAFSNYLIPVTR